MTDVAVRGPSDASEGVVRLVRRLCAALDAEDVPYCHWKSNAFLDRSLRAENDLDLLVDAEAEGRLAEVLLALGFREARRPSHAVPGIADHYGYDADADVLVHVHAHTALVVGDDLTKSYRLPLERAFLAGAVRTGTLPVPPPELELVALVLRLVLKHCTWDALLLRRGAVPASAWEELRFLEARADRDAVAPLLAAHLPAVDAALLAACRRALEPDAGVRERVAAGRRLCARLRPYARRSRAADVALKTWRRGAASGRRLSRRRPPRKRLARGGAVVAVVGPDGAGKSTLVDGLCRWLAGDLAVATVHLGRPPRSWATWAVRAAQKLAGERPALRMLLAVATARDRRRAYAGAVRAAAEGVVVLCDRFPLPELTLMDAPRIPVTGDGRLRALLARRERAAYASFARPDVLIALRVAAATAAARRPDEDQQLLRARWDDAARLDWETLGAHVLDADGPADDVLAAAKALVWSEL